MIKAYDLIEKKVISVFNENNYFVKSYSPPNDLPHNININEKGLSCPRYNADGFCCHAIAVSFQTKSLEKYACVLPKCEERNATAIVSQKIDIKKFDRKSVARSRKKQMGSPEKEVRISSQIMFLVIPMKAWQQALDLWKESKGCLHHWGHFRMHLLEDSSKAG